MAEYNGQTNGAGMRFAVVASRYNDFITGKLVRGAQEALQENGVAQDDIDVFWCPGGLEIPALAVRVAHHGTEGRKYQGMICIGCVIRGDTDHYTFVATESVHGVAELAREAQIGMGNAILTVEDTDQALERAGEKSANKGYEAALAALEMANHFRAIK